MLEARTYADWQPEGQNSPVHSHAMTVDDLREEGIYRFLTPDQAASSSPVRGPARFTRSSAGCRSTRRGVRSELFADAVLSGDS